MKYYITPLLLLLLLSCETENNDPVARMVDQDGKVVVVLTGKRPLNTHDPISLGKSYKDTFLLFLPNYEEGTILGNEIPVNPGYYKYSGKVVISGNKLTVALSAINTDDNTIDPLSWNGTYRLERP